MGKVYKENSGKVNEGQIYECRYLHIYCLYFMTEFMKQQDLHLIGGFAEKLCKKNTGLPSNVSHVN